ncbi:YadA-like family protein [Achromobacter deleyi]|uniref:YadA-like family protein n=1 Tax=Achromobacter deleyi TaxID=1353891 RepID=A0A7T4E0S0_9BURK|nr:YadA-like family protein [Achromobacter deleyi]QQB32467.1 YadA-like family protein [Achromobacter deleyi]
MAAQVAPRSLRRRVSALLRLACRVLGLKRRKGMGLALLGTAGLALGATPPAFAANGLHINANADFSCVSINDPQTSVRGGSSVDTYLRENFQFTDNTERCSPEVGGKINYGGVGQSRDYVLFFPGRGASGVGARSLMLGGELAVNSGYIKLGDATTGQRIGLFDIDVGDPLGLELGGLAEAKRLGIALGHTAQATGAEGATALGNGSRALGEYATVAGIASLGRGLRSTVLGPSSLINADYSVAVGRFVQIGADATHAVALGRSTIVRNADSVAIGLSAATSSGLSVSLGSGAQTRDAIAPSAVVLNGISHRFDSTPLQAVVSVGSAIRQRQILYVAPGMVDARSTDAINGSQLFAAYDAIKARGAVDQAQEGALARNAADLASARGGQAAMTGSFARAVGNASVDAQGRVVMPAAASGNGAAPGQPATVLGAVAAFDRDLRGQDDRLGQTFDQALALIDKVDGVTLPLQGLSSGETVAGRIDDLKEALLMWDPVQGVYRATPVAGSSRRISNLAAGQAETDAVNKGQLDQAITQVVAQRDGLLRESGGQLQVGAQSAATVVNLAGNAPQRDARGNPVLGADGQPVMAATDRQVTGVAAGVNGNDAANKGQLDGVAQTATAARDAAAQAGQAANAAGEAAAGAQRAADAAQGTASGAQQAATAARDAATAAQRSADSANARLAGIGDGETVAGRIDQAASAATDAAGRAANQALAAALGGGATVGADGKAGAPAYAISQIGADGQVAGQARTAANVGDAVAALDANVIRVNDRVLAQDGKLGPLMQDLSGLRDDSLLWDEGAQAFSASHGSASPNRVINVAEGQARTDAVNLGQLDAVAQLADAAGDTAAAAQSAADTAQGAATQARQDARQALGAVDGARQAIDTADSVAAAARQSAQAAQEDAAQVRQRAETAQRAAAQAQQQADAAQGAASGAKLVADDAQAAATQAGQHAGTARATAATAGTAAEAARQAAAAAQQSADSANARLVGIGDGETVAGRIDQAASAATDAAGRTASQALADALGGGVTVGADGKAGAPAYAIRQIGADGEAADQALTAANVGDALAALDGSVIKVNDRVRAQDARAAQLTQDLSGLRDDSLLWDEGAQAFSASHGGASPNRVINVAEGQARTDAVNVGQLHTVAQVADAAGNAAAMAQSQADTAQGAATQARQDARQALGAVDGARQAIDTADSVAAAARQSAQAAQEDAAQVRQRAETAQRAAAQAQQQADAAQGAASGAKLVADDAQAAATQAGQHAGTARATAATAGTAAEAARQAAAAAQQSADDANARLVGIGDGETVAGRIDQAASAATDAAGRTASQALADALGGGVTVGADGKAGAPAYAIRQIGADGEAADQALTAANVGDALAALDGSVIKVNDRVRAQDARAAQLTQDLGALGGDGMRWDAGAAAFSAARAGDSPQRIVQAAAGIDATDAINLGQVQAVAGTAATAADLADGAGRTAQAADATATAAAQSADAAGVTAGAARQAADAADARLAGLGAGETAVGRIAQASQAASQARADALGGGAAVRADGSPQAPAYAVTAIGPDGRVQAPTAPATSVGAAVQALDDSLVAVNDHVRQVRAEVATMRDQLDAGELGLVRQDAATRDITVARQADGTRVTLAGTDGARTVSGVKEGGISASSSEAVTGSQLFRVNQDLLANTRAVGDLEALTGRQGVTLTALSDQVRSGDVGLTRDEPASNRVTVAADRGGDQLAVSGTQGARQVTGVRDGRVQAGGNDAVTGGQLHAVTERVNRLDAQAGGVAVDNRGAGRGAAATPGNGGVAAGANARVTGERGTAIGGDAQARAEQASALGAGANAQAAGGTAVGANATATATGSVALGEGSQAILANTVSIGADGGERQLVNVAEATAATDAVNLRQAIQLSRQDANQARQQANRYTDSRVGQLRRASQAGIASSMAMAALPSTSTPGKSMVAVGASSYGGQSAVAMGVSARSRGGAWVYRASLSGTTGGQTGASVSLTYAW